MWQDYCLPLFMSYWQAWLCHCFLPNRAITVPDLGSSVACSPCSFFPGDVAWRDAVKGFFQCRDIDLKSFFLRSFTWRNWRVWGSKWPPQLRGWVGRAKRLTYETSGKSMFPQSVKLWYSEMTCYSLFGWGIQSTLVSCLEWSCLCSQRCPSEMQPL